MRRRGVEGRSRALRDGNTRSERGIHGPYNLAVAKFVTREQFTHEYAHVFEGSKEWQAIHATASEMYGWDSRSTYIQNPPYFGG